MLPNLMPADVAVSPIHLSVATSESIRSRIAITFAIVAPPSPSSVIASANVTFPCPTSCDTCEMTGTSWLIRSRIGRSGLMNPCSASITSPSTCPTNCPRSSVMSLSCTCGAPPDVAGSVLTMFQSTSSVASRFGKFWFGPPSPA
jgi:hypothetical protein